jgi:hypothetical protein
MLLLSSRAVPSAARTRNAAPPRAVAVAPRAFVRGGSGGGAPLGDSNNNPKPTTTPAAADPAAAAKALSAAVPAPTAAKPTNTTSTTKPPRRRTTTKRAPSDDDSSSASPARGRSTSPGGTRRTRTKTATADGTAPAASDGPAKRPRARSRSPASPTVAAAAAAQDSSPAATSKPAADKKKPANNTNETNVIPVGFLTKRRVQFGLELAVVGETDALGAWDPSLAVPLRWCDGDVWVGSAAVPAPADASTPAVVLAYKYIVRAPDGTVVQWQPSDNRVIELSADRAALERALADAPKRAVPAEAKGVLAGVAVAVEDEFDGDRHQLVKCVVAE